MMLSSSAMTNPSNGNVVPQNRQFSKLSGIIFSDKIFSPSQIFPNPSFVLVRLVDEFPEDVIELLHVFCTIMFADVADQRSHAELQSDVYL